MATAEEGPGPLQYQTLALKVSIHCEGCKRKVKKVLQSIEGVYKTDVDTQQQKVVVVGNVSVDALVKKLVKTGKHAEPWPEPAPPPSEASQPGGGGGKKKKKKNRSKSPANSKLAEPGTTPAGATAEGGGAPEKHDHAGTCDEASGDEKPEKLEGGGGGGSTKEVGAGDPHGGGGAGMVVPVAMTPHGQQPLAPTTNGGGGGGGKNKKGKKGGHGNGNANANANGDGAGATVESSPHDAPTNPAAGNAGPHAGAGAVDAGAYPPATAYQPATAMSYPGYYSGAGGHMPPPYAMSYSTAHPLRSSAYYHPMVGGAYTGGGGGGYFYSTAPATAAPGSYYMFSEENANACSVM